MPSYVRYDDALETLEDGEKETIESIAEVMTKGQHLVRKKYGESVRISHAKAHGFVKGKLIVSSDLPPELAQGLFAKAGEHDVLVRISQAPGEMLDDRKVSAPRGMAIKVFGVDGPKLPEHAGESTQDFVLDTGKIFVKNTLKSFLAGFTVNSLVAPKLPEAVKGIVSKTAQAANAALNAVGVDAPTADTYGHPDYHPLGEAYYSQIAIRYGDHVAKLAVIPANAPLQAIFEKGFDMKGEDALRVATVEYFRENAAEFDVKIQLATDPERMPIEDPMVEWSEDESPYRTVARLVLPAQNAFDSGLQSIGDRELSFSPAHALEAHRPLGRFGRARIFVYTTLAKRRRQENGRPTREPRSLADVERRATSMPVLAPRADVDLSRASFVWRHPVASIVVGSAGLAVLAWLLIRDHNNL